MIQNLNLQSCLHPQKYFHSDLPSAKNICVSFFERVYGLCNFHSYAGIRVSSYNFASTRTASDHFIENNIIKYQNGKNNRTLKTSAHQKRQNVENVSTSKTSEHRKRPFSSASSTFNLHTYPTPIRAPTPTQFDEVIHHWCFDVVSSLQHSDFFVKVNNPNDY